MKGGDGPETALHSTARSARRAFGAAAVSGGAALHGLLQRGELSSGLGLALGFALVLAPCLLALEVGKHGVLQRLAGAQDRFDIALLGAVETAAEQEQFRKTVDVVERSPKIMGQGMKVG